MEPIVDQYAVLFHKTSVPVFGMLNSVDPDQNASSVV